MTDAAAIAPIALSDGSQVRLPSQTLSLDAYQNWLSTNGLMPVGHVLGQHPSKIASTAATEVNNLAGRWDNMIDSTVAFLSEGSGERLANDLVKSSHPGPARLAVADGIHAEPQSVSGVVGQENQPVSPAVETAREASMAIQDASVTAIRQQWQQTVAIMEHSVSREVISSAIQVSISASKEMNEGLDTLLRS